MPLLTFDLIEGRTEQEVKNPAGCRPSRRATRLRVPERDRYQIVHETKPTIW